jgi:tryptophanyl-tRNA synthetase
MSDANKDAEIFLFLANMHALTTLHDAKELRQNSINMLKLYAACGADLSRYYIFSPADVPAHAQLHWVFSCLTNM